MAITITRTETDLLGSVASPASIAANATSTSTALDLTTGGVVEASLAAHLIAGGSAPTTAVAIQFQFSEDGTNFYADGGSISLTMVASTTYDFRYDPPASAKKAQVAITNGATNAITAYAQGNTLAVS